MPWLFEGRLPDLNLGTAGGREKRRRCANVSPVFSPRSDAYTHVVDGPFKGSYVARHYGRPAEGVHAVQMEMCWGLLHRERATRLRRDARRAAAVVPVLRSLARR